MIKLQSFGDWKQVQSFSRANGWKLSNCYFLPSEIRRLVEKGVLSLKMEDTGLFLLEDCGSFYRCYYSVSPVVPPCALSLDREAVIEFPYSGELNHTQQYQINWLISLGFVLCRESCLMACETKSLNTFQLIDVHDVSLANDTDTSGIYSLLLESFDPRFAFLPSLEDLSQAVQEKKVFVVQKFGKIVGALVSGFEKTIASIHQVAVDPDYRGKKIGSALVEAYHRHYCGHATAFRHWVDNSNHPAIALYNSFGYKFSLRKANEYVLSPKTTSFTER